MTQKFIDISTVVAKLTTLQIEDIITKAIEEAHPDYEVTSMKFNVKTTHFGMAHNGFSGHSVDGVDVTLNKRGVR